MPGQLRGNGLVIMYPSALAGMTASELRSSQSGNVYAIIRDEESQYYNIDQRVDRVELPP